MRFKDFLSRIALAITITGMAANAAAQGGGLDDMSNDVMVTRHFTGIWDQVDQEAQGIALQVVEQFDGARRAVAYWFTYGTDRQTAWFVAIGDLVENRIEFELFDSTNVGFMQDDLPGNDSVQSIGTMTIVFDSCQSGEVTYSSGLDGVGSGTFRIERLLEVMNTHCSGGLSDDMHAGGMFGEQRVELLPARDGVTGSGQARYEDFPGHSEFEVTVNGLEDGNYDLIVGGQIRGNMTVDGGYGELKYASPAEDGRLMLNFDPRELQIEMHDDVGAVLSSFDDNLVADDDQHNGNHGDGHDYDCQSSSGSGHGMGGAMGGGMGGMGNCVDDGEYVEIESDLENTGTLPEAEGYAEWSMNAHRVQFSVAIENVPGGTYTLSVSGQEVGVIEAVQMHSGVAGRITFRDPEAYGMRHLDFEPRGEMIKVLQGETVILQVQFPTE